jgi:hypothetical protein
MTALGKSALIEQLHQQRDGTANLALALLVAADRPQVINPQTRGKAGLCKPGPLANGFEGRRVD